MISGGMPKRISPSTEYSPMMVPEKRPCSLSGTCSISVELRASSPSGRE
jgi:hypothetical protein